MGEAMEYGETYGALLEAIAEQAVVLDYQDVNSFRGHGADRPRSRRGVRRGGVV